LTVAMSLNFFSCAAIAASQSFGRCVIVAELAQIFAVLVIAVRFYFSCVQ